MKYDINNLPDKVKVVKENDVWPLKTEISVNQRMVFKELIYLGLEAGILEPYDEEEEEQEKLREEIIRLVVKFIKHKVNIGLSENILIKEEDEHKNYKVGISIRSVLKDYKITKI